MLPAEDGNVSGCKAKVQKLLIADLAEPFANPLLRGIASRMNKSAHEARRYDQVPGWTNDTMGAHNRTPNVLFKQASQSDASKCNGHKPALRNRFSRHKSCYI